MSHSTVTVVIRDAEDVHEAFEKLDDILEPFNENIQVPPYFVASSDEEVKHAVEFYQAHPEYCDGEQGPERPYDDYVTQDPKSLQEWTRQAVGGYERSDPKDGVYDEKKQEYGSLSTYNPLSRWDWWALGGRWHGYYMTKPGVTVGAERRQFGMIGDATDNTTRLPEIAEASQAILGAGSWGGDGDEDFTGKADLARKGDIDFDTMRALAASQAELTYDAFEKATEGLKPGAPFEELVTKAFVEAGYPTGEPEFQFFMSDEEDDDVRRKAYQEILNVARKAYHEDPWIAALKDAGLLSWFSNPREDFCVDTGGREAYIQAARDDTARTFALLVDGEWYEKGRMGWFGMAHNEQDESVWGKAFAEKLDSLDDDVYLAIVDVHI